ncbi:MAG TPA: alpha/beta fold hydrolase [Acetobacteraceae bacterium]|nr:alpha/beta fold hydrolase [Acetobacteraceae bacterium]
MSEAGQGPALILLHGLFGAGKNLGALSRGLTDRFRVLSLDLRNHGASFHASPMDYETQAQDVIETMDRAGIGEAMLIGHSMGGKVAMRLALDHPDRLTALIVMDIAPLPYAHAYGSELDAMRNLPLAPGLTRQQADAALARDMPDPALRSFLMNNLILGDAPHWRLGLDEIAEAMPDILDWHDATSPPAYRKPALFLFGAKSDYVGAEGQKAIRKQFPHAELVPVPNAGHWLHAEQPGAVLAEINRFLRSAL